MSSSFPRTSACVLRLLLFRKKSSHAELSPLNFDGHNHDPFRLQRPPLVLRSLTISFYALSVRRRPVRPPRALGVHLNFGLPGTPSSRSHEGTEWPVLVLKPCFLLLDRCFLTLSVRIETKNHQQTGHPGFDLSATWAKIARALHYPLCGAWALQGVSSSCSLTSPSSQARSRLGLSFSTGLVSVVFSQLMPEMKDTCLHRRHTSDESDVGAS